MRLRPHGRTLALLVGTVVAFQWSLTAQTPAASAKRPIGYDVMDSWRSIAGTKLSSDGQWLAYALTAQGDDGELVVRNLKSKQEFRSARGTSPTFTPDGRFVVFTIAQAKADEEKEREQTQRQGEAGAEGRGQGGRGNQAARTPRTGLGIMSLPDGKVTTVDKVGSFRVPDENSTWLAYYKGVGGTGGGRAGRGGAAGRGAAGGRQGAPPAAAAGEGRQGSANGTREKRKDPGFDLILRNLATGEETTIPEVTEYEFDTKGALLAYATSSADAAKDGAFVRKTADGAVTTLLSGRGHYKSLAFDDAGTQLAFLSDKEEYEKPVAPYRLYYWKPAAAAAAELVSAATPGMLKGMVVSDNAAPRFSKDGARLFLGTAPPPAAPADRRQDPGADPGRPVVLQGPDDPADAEGARRAGAHAQLPGDGLARRQEIPPARDAGAAHGQYHRRRRECARPERPAVSHGDFLGPGVQRRLRARPEDPASRSRCSSTGAATSPRSPRAASTCSISTRARGTGSPIASPTACA